MSGCSHVVTIHGSFDVLTIAGHWTYHDAESVHIAGLMLDQGSADSDSRIQPYRTVGAMDRRVTISCGAEWAA